MGLRDVPLEPATFRDSPLRSSRPGLLIFIVAYHAETTIKDVLTRIPHALVDQYDTEVLIIDDASRDQTFERSREVVDEGLLPFPVTVLFNPVNQGYGGNQKIGYFYAIKSGFTFVALLHGDGQYAPECLPDLVRPLKDGAADACFGSRMMTKKGARRGGMPLYKFVGNKILTWFENWLLRTSFTEFHSGYRVYSVAALKQVPFDLNTNDFHFDTEIIIQFVRAGLRIVERPIPTYYGDEICRVDGLKYAWNVARSVVKARAQEVGLFYDRRFDLPEQDGGNEQYRLKLDYESPHSFALQAVPPNSRVLDLGCAGGYLAALLKQRKGCHVVGIDMYPLPNDIDLDAFHKHDLNHGFPKLDVKDFDILLLLDVIEHLCAPERFVHQLRNAVKLSPNVNIVVSTGNIGFIVTRLMLLLGQFQLRQARHPRHDPHSAIHIWLFAGFVRTGRFSHPRNSWHTGSVSISPGKQLVSSLIASSKPDFDPSLEGAFLLPDDHGGKAISITRILASKRRGAIRCPRRDYKVLGA